jgi:DNA-binding transcriptional LysR family regulator
MPKTGVWSAKMTVLIDIDQLRTFIAIAETGSFTKAADIVHKTQSAVSMQMKRLEERLDKPIFARDGRASKLTEDGERLLDYARRIVKLNLEAIAAFAGPELTGSVRLGVPDDYADRYLPEIMARYSRAYPGVELTVVCEPSVDLLERIDLNELDLAIVTTSDNLQRPSETFRRERLLWVTSSRHGTHQSTAPAVVHEFECRRGRRRRACGPCDFGIAGIGIAPRHARAHPRRRFPGIALLPHRPCAQSARNLPARGCARRAHHLLARQPVGGRAGGGVAL